MNRNIRIYKNTSLMRGFLILILRQTIIVIESDVTLFNNSDTKKVGVAMTYKNCVGFAPMMSYVDISGFMLNNELRNGDAHSTCAGTDRYFTFVILF